jgi:hypothetical protein
MIKLKMAAFMFVSRFFVISFFLGSSLAYELWMNPALSPKQRAFF